MSDPSRYSDRQVALILQRAATLQATGDESHHSLEEIQQLAAQVGIPSELVARAAAELESGGESPGPSGPGTSYYATRTVPARAEPALYPELLSVMRRIMRVAGEVTEIAGALEWRNRVGSSTVTVTVAPGKEETAIRVEAEHRGEKGMTYVFAGLLTFLSTLPTLDTGSGALTAAVAASAAVVWFTAARLLWGRIARRAQERVARLRDALADRIAKG